MTTSKTDVCNLVCDIHSADQVSDVENPSSATEALFARWYDKSRRKLLRSHPWNFASKRIVLSASSVAPVFGYTSKYPMPADFIRLCWLEDSDGNIIPSENYRFETNAVLYSADSGVVNLVYVYDFEDVAGMDALFLDLLVLEIAAGVAFKFTDSAASAERIQELIKSRTPDATSVDGQESPPIIIQRSRIIEARRRGFSTRTDRFS